MFKLKTFCFVKTLKMSDTVLYMHEYGNLLSKKAIIKAVKCNYWFLHHTHTHTPTREKNI